MRIWIVVWLFKCALVRWCLLCYPPHLAFWIYVLWHVWCCFDPSVTRLQSFELEEVQEVHNSATDDIGEAWPLAGQCFQLLWEVEFFSAKERQLACILWELSFTADHDFERGVGVFSLADKPSTWKRSLKILHYGWLSEGWFF